MKRILLLSSALTLMSLTSEIHAKSWSKRFDLTNKTASLKEAGIDFFFSDIPQNQLINGRDLSAIPGETLPERLANEMSHRNETPDPFSFTIDENFYQLTQSFDAYKESFAGQLIAYHNRSDDTDVNLQVVLDGYDALKPNKTYLIKARIDFVTNAPANRPGIGGAVDSNSFGLAVSQNPWTIEADDASDPQSMIRTYTLDDKGNKVFLGVPSGLCATTPFSMMSDDERFICSRYSYMGRVCNGLDESEADPETDYQAWLPNSLQTKVALKFRSDDKGGPLYINLNSHSGFEGLTVYYLQGLEISVEEVQTDLL